MQLPSEITYDGHGAMDEIEHQIFTEEEAAFLLKMTPLMLARRRRAGKIAAIKDGHFIRYTWQHLVAYQKSFQRRGGRTADELSPEALLKALSRQLLDKKLR
jgi:hypothetical protein